MADKKAKKIETVRKIRTKGSKSAIAEAAVTRKTTSRSAKQDSFLADVFGLTGEKVGTVSLPKEIFGAQVNKILLAQAVRVYRSNLRSGTASTKTRGEVAGSTRKIYRQKGTGRARHGAIRAPIFVGGGIVFGPRPRDFRLEFPQKMRRAALFSALSAKLQDNRVMVADTEKASGKSSEFSKMIRSLNVANKKGKGNKVLFVVPASSDASVRAARNLEGVELTLANQLNALDVLTNRYVLFAKNSIDVLSSTFLKEK